MRIHEELRDSDDTAHSARTLPDAAPPAAPVSPKQAAFLPERSESLAARMQSLEEKVAAAPSNTSWWRSYPAAGLLIGLVVVGGAFASWIQGRVENRLAQADARVAAADRQRETASQLASNQIAATRAEAVKQVAEARNTAMQAQLVGNVLAAPDVLRYDLNGTAAASRANAKVTFSRTRGLLFSASRLPQLKAGTTYQLWLITGSGPFNAGLFTPDASGRATFMTDTPGNVPRRVTGAFVTLEPSGGGPQPSGTTILEKLAR
jgi:hypothetical protein